MNFPCVSEYHAMKVHVLFEHHAVKTYWGSERIAPRAGRFTSGEGTHGTHRIVSLVGPRTGLDAVVKRRYHFPSLFICKSSFICSLRS